MWSQANRGRSKSGPLNNEEMNVANKDNREHKDKIMEKVKIKQTEQELN